MFLQNFLTDKEKKRKIPNAKKILREEQIENSLHFGCGEILSRHHHHHRRHHHLSTSLGIP
jgi:hypothetical protein